VFVHGGFLLFFATWVRFFLVMSSVVRFRAECLRRGRWCMLVGRGYGLLVGDELGNEGGSCWVVVS
jgi:hypothetical protein